MLLTSRIFLRIIFILFMCEHLMLYVLSAIRFYFFFLSFYFRASSLSNVNKWVLFFCCSYRLTLVSDRNHNPHFPTVYNNNRTEIEKKRKKCWTKVAPVAMWKIVSSYHSKIGSLTYHKITARLLADAENTVAHKQNEKKNIFNEKISF